MVLVAVTAAMMSLVISCSMQGQEEKSVTVSIQPQKELLEAIVGDKLKVRSLLASGGDPETYDPSMSHLLNVEKSMAYFRVGSIGFEDAIIERVKLSCPDLPIIDTSEGITRIEGTHDGGYDPHVWGSVKNARIMAANMLEAVCRLDTANAKTYRANYRELIEHLDSIDVAVQEALVTAPSRTFVVWHPSLSYFARDYGLRQIALGTDHKERSPETMKVLMDSASRSGALIFMAEGGDERAERMARDELGMEVHQFNIQAYDWAEQLLDVAKALSTAQRQQ
ncbi:MAG: zinc ABC transporter substrate-binding protein [Candidatus Amulumruptor caecigallinarius]|nr:zinc ABC transporter substrate-binding protein [Candidatus Amulumruptor caecigallinarius]MCM1453487.1 zinc ABC transporter substrate-binding protein [bacterium]